MLFQNNIPFEYSMSAFGTKKPFGDRGVQLTFPREFQKAYDLPLAYYPSSLGGALDLMVGEDFQAQYHDEKRIDANKRVMDGIHANKTKEQKLLTGPHNYHLPKPVLSQRIYANPMNGADMPYSTRRDNGKDAPFRTIEVGQEGASLRGGVVRSIEGQQFYKKQLERRIAQLNRMNALAQGYAVQIGQSYKTEDNEKDGSTDKVTFFVYFRALRDAVITGELGSFSFDNVKDLLKMLFKFAPTASQEDLNEVIDGLDLIIENVRTGLNQQPNVQNNRPKYAYFSTLADYMSKMREFATQMFANINLSERDKKTLVRSLVKSLGFEKVLLGKADLKDVVRDERQRNERFDQEAEDYDGEFGDDDDDEGGDGRFNRPAQTREDEDAQGIPRQPFAGRNDDPNRQQFGRRTGVIVYGGPAYFGDDQQEDLLPAYVAPLSMAGTDPNAYVAPRANPDILRETVEDVVQQTLRPLGYTAGDDEKDFIERNYADPSLFVNEVATRMEEQGFSKAQIAEGMSQTALDVFADYIAENAGETAPTAIQAARPAGLAPLGGLQPPIYRDDNDDGLADIDTADAVGVRQTETKEPVRRKIKVKKEAPAETSKAKMERTLNDLNLPKTREEMYRRFTTPSDYKELGLRIPPTLGGPYKMRQGTKLKNAKAAIINIYKTHIDPDF